MKKNILDTLGRNSKCRLPFLAVITSLCLFACEDGFDDDEDPKFYGEVIADHLDTPWEITFAPDGRLFFTQRPGSIGVIENGNMKVWLALDSAVEEVGESGLFGITLHPQFNQNGYVYFGYTYAESKSPLKQNFPVLSSMIELTS
jgi:glucose/arabinose dehydrogenase